MAKGRADTEKAFDRFLAKYHAKYDKAAACLAKDRRGAGGIPRFPCRALAAHPHRQPHREHLCHRPHRTTRSKGCLSHDTAIIMGFKLIQTAQSSSRKLDGQNQLPKLVEGIKFTDGIEANQKQAAA